MLNFPEKRGENFRKAFVETLKSDLNVDIEPSDVLAIHRIPGKEDDLFSLMKNTIIIPGYRTDHSAYFSSSQLVLKSYWKFNSHLLRDADYIQRVKSCIKDTTLEYHLSALGQRKFAVDISSRYTGGLPQQLEETLSCHVWGYTQPFKQRQSNDPFLGQDINDGSNTFLECFSVVHFTDYGPSNTNEKVYLQCAHHQLTLSMEHNFKSKISEDNFHKFLRYVKAFCPKMTQECESLLHGYYLASRKTRSSESNSKVPVSALKTFSPEMNTFWKQNPDICPTQEMESSQEVMTLPTLETTIDDIEEPDATKYINLLKDKIVIDQFPLKIKIIITSEFATAIAFDRIESHYSHPAKVVLTQNNLSKFYDDLIDKFKAWVDQFQERGSGFDFNTYLYPVVKNKQRVTNYKEYEDEISMRGIEYPVAKEDIPKVEKQNNLIINVFALKDQTNKQTLDPIYVSNKESEKCYVVDLLYIENNGNAHYCLIKDLDSFMCDNNGHKQFTCRNCIQGFQREETLENTKKICYDYEPCRTIMPEPGKNIVEFNNHHFKNRLPFVIYCDFEACNIPMQSCTPDPDKSYTKTNFKTRNK
ncbi:unnamed protein product [Mytilus coruscus]|uniref:Uncharacterized protein n=1 Tax=Mytilus coruscus TaxID=42192 RepID=A0A6J8CDI6_MYTCO|nr:unnamed protein product [Mytilus coruscus]